MTALPSSGSGVETDLPCLGPNRGEKLDAYLPPDGFPRPVPAVLLIHGGGWHGGDFYGDYDIRGRKVSPFAGATPEETRAHEEAASPVTYIGKDTPPVFITHGTADKTVPVERSRLLAKHLEQLGVAHEYVQIEGASHSYHLQPEQTDLRPAVLAFLEKHLGKPGATP